MDKPQKSQHLLARLRVLPRKYVIIGLFAVGVFFYSIIFFIPKQTVLSYAGETCVKQVSLLPNILQPAGDPGYKVKYDQKVSIGNLSVLSSRSCFTPTKEPKTGKTTIAVAPWGGWIARKHFVIIVPKKPLAQISSFAKPIPVTKPISVKLDSPDTLHSYKLSANQQTSDCTAVHDVIKCDNAPLKLQQSKSYNIEVNRYFGDKHIDTPLRASMKTLKAVAIRQVSVKNGQTVYDKPTSFAVVADKPLERAEVTLKNVSSKKEIPVQTQVDGTRLLMRIAAQLPREARYNLHISKLEATDGSSLAEPRNISFTMSGGPKVVGISIGQSKVASAQQFYITFDQATESGAAKFISLKGGTAEITKTSDKTVTVSLLGLPRCQDFSVNVAKGMRSKHGIVSSSSWTYGSRTLCHSISTIGSSVHGRPIQAYTFGNSGPSTLFIGALHGNEVSSSLILNDWINYLETRGKQIPNRVVVVPTANPDGVAAGTRNNARGVNLNRNFPTDNWTRDIKDTNGNVKNGGGSKPLSEPEARALASLTQSLRPRLLLSYHAVGSLVIGDPGGYSAGYAGKYAGMVGYRNATGQPNTFDYNITGAYEDWSYRNAGVPSMVIELGSYSYRNFSHHQAAMWAMLQ